MPRGKSGGPRQGAPGQTYSNRTDLNSAPRPGNAAPPAPAQPTRPIPGQPYGQQGQQVAAQRAIPLPNAPAGAPTPNTTPTPGGPGAAAVVAPGGPTGAGAPPSPGDLLAAPGQLGDFGGPSLRPNEPVTAGAALGAGPGPEALQGPDPLVRAAAILNTIGQPDAWTRRLTAQVNATLNNQGAP